jgi:hypothetical protein
MFKTLTNAMLALVVIGANSAFAGSSLRSAGVLKFEEYAKDFGAVNRGEILRHEFKFRNDGTGPILIQGVHSSCGCTAAETDVGKTYQPGDGGVIKVSFDTSDFIGDVAKSVMVITNETGVVAKTLTLKAAVNAEIAVNPPMINFGQMPAGQTKELVAEIRKSSTVPDLRVTVEKYDPKFLDVSVVEQGDRWQVKAAMKPGLTSGFYKDDVILRSTAKYQQSIKIPVRANLIGAVVAAPAYIEFGALSKQAVSRRTIKLKSKSDIAIKNSSIELKVNGQKRGSGSDMPIAVRVVSESGDEQTIEVEMTNKSNDSGSVHGKITFAVEDPYQKEVSIDFYGYML